MHCELSYRSVIMVSYYFCSSATVSQCDLRSNEISFLLTWFIIVENNFPNVWLVWSIISKEFMSLCVCSLWFLKSLRVKMRNENSLTTLPFCIQYIYIISISLHHVPIIFNTLTRNISISLNILFWYSNSSQYFIFLALFSLRQIITCHHINIIARSLKKGRRRRIRRETNALNSLAKFPGNRKRNT